MSLNVSPLNAMNEVTLQAEKSVSRSQMHTANSMGSVMIVSLLVKGRFKGRALWVTKETLLQP